MCKYIFLIGCLVCMMVNGSAQKTNIILIVADDLGYGDVGCYGQQKIKTPNIDRLAKQGVRFTQFYAGTTVCAPSRASLMSGLHTGHTAVRGNVSSRFLIPLPHLSAVCSNRVIKPRLLENGGLAISPLPVIPTKKALMNSMDTTASRWRIIISPIISGITMNGSTFPETSIPIPCTRRILFTEEHCPF